VKILLTCKRFHKHGLLSFDYSINNNKAIQLACAGGRIPFVKLILRDRRVDPSTNGNVCIVTACQQGKWEIVRELLKDPRVDPSVNDNKVLLIACEKVRLLQIKELTMIGRSQDCKRTYEISQPYKSG
jgi:hypothetical protein